jgi:hypothetical protein
MPRAVSTGIESAFVFAEPHFLTANRRGIR